MSWKYLFKPHILERGYGYYCENAVENYQATATEIRADVIGTDDYEVVIDLEKGQITNMYCSCPHAEEGRSCKHMAAVLYQWDECFQQDENIRADEVPLSKKSEIQQLVESADISVVKSYLTTILAEDETLLVRFRNILGKKTTKEDVTFYKNQVNSIANHYLGRQHFINYYDAPEFISALEVMLDKDVGLMIENEEYMSAFELMNYILAFVGDIEMDDSDGRTGILADQIYELWLKLLSNVKEEEKKDMFQWFSTHLDGSIIDYLEDYILRILMEEFDEIDYVQQKLSLVEDMIRKAEAKEDEWSRNYHVGTWALYYISLLEKQNASKEVIEDFYRQHWECSNIREHYIDKCVQSKDYDKAIQILDESLHKDREYGGLVSKYSKRKKDIFLIKGDKEAYLHQLWELVLVYEAGDIELYRELKAQYTKDEWLEKREEVFEKLPKNAYVDVLYKEEELYDRLLEYVLQSQGLYALQQYSDVLKKDYPEQILNKFKNEINELASYSGDRKKYKSLVGLLRYMKKIQGGIKVVDEIVAQWKIQYRNRPAMMDELKKL